MDLEARRGAEGRVSPRGQVRCTLPGVVPRHVDSREAGLSAHLLRKRHLPCPAGVCCPASLTSEMPHSPREAEHGAVRGRQSKGRLGAPGHRRPHTWGPCLLRLVGLRGKPSAPGDSANSCRSSRAVRFPGYGCPGLQQQQAGLMTLTQSTDFCIKGKGPDSSSSSSFRRRCIPPF